MTTSAPLTQYRQAPGRYHGPALAALRAATGAGRFRPAAYVLPDAPNQTLAAGLPIEIRLSLPVGSSVWAFAGSSSQAAGFEVQVIDLREGAAFWSGPVNWANVTGQGNPSGISAPLFILPAPRLVIEPAVLSVKIRNRAAVANTVELVVYVIEPEEAPE